MLLILHCVLQNHFEDKWLRGWAAAVCHPGWVGCGGEALAHPAAPAGPPRMLPLAGGGQALRWKVWWLPNQTPEHWATTLG